MIKQNQTYLNRLHVVMDAVCIYLAGYVAYYIRFKLNIHGFWLNKEIFEYNRYYKEFYQYQQPLIASLIFLLLLYSFFGLYTPKRYQRGSKELVNLVKANLIGLGVSAFVITVFQIQNLLVAYKERYDKDNFIKNLLLDNLLLVDIFNRAKKLHIEMNARRVVYIVETSKEKDNGALETVRSMFAGGNKDFITAVDEKNIIIVKEIKDKDTYEDLEKTAQVIVDMLNTEAMARVRVAFGTIIKDIKEVSRSYKEAKMALDVGKIFYSDKKVMAYSNLGIGRLIYQLPLPLCKMFIKEIFDDNTPDNFDEETLTTINKFFENNLNVSETSRKLYVHRNTLVYRLEKIKKITGLDLREFDHAIVFKVAMMVKMYLDSLNSSKY